MSIMLMVMLMVMKPSYEDLEEEVKLLKTELGIFAVGQELGVIVQRLRLTPCEGRALLALYKARSVLTPEHLARACVKSPNSDCSAGAASVRVYRIKKKLGYGTIDTVKDLGYALSSTGRERVRAVLNG